MKKKIYNSLRIIIELLELKIDRYNIFNSLGGVRNEIFKV